MRCILNEKPLWGVVLAGGDGTRVRRFTERCLGCAGPKQYCAITGTRSMLQHTLDRTLMLIPRHRLLTVVTRKHLPFTEEQLSDLHPENVLVQPQSRDTGIAIFYALMKIHRVEPDSTVVVIPSDHFILKERLFMEYIRQAGIFSAEHPEFIVLLGVRPDKPEPEYGWIECGNGAIYKHNDVFHHVVKFWEKPETVKAEALHAMGSFWNTFVFIGQTATLLKHVRTLMPETIRLFGRVQEAMGSCKEQEEIEAAFSRVLPVNFSTIVLQQMPEHLCVLDVSDVCWSDWGDERRIRYDAERYNFHLNLLPVFQEKSAQLRRLTPFRVPHVDLVQMNSGLVQSR